MHINLCLTAASLLLSLAAALPSPQLLPRAAATTTSPNQAGVELKAIRNIRFAYTGLSQYMKASFATKPRMYDPEATYSAKYQLAVQFISLTGGNTTTVGAALEVVLGPDGSGDPQTRWAFFFNGTRIPPTTLQGIGSGIGFNISSTSNSATACIGSSGPNAFLSECQSFALGPNTVGQLASWKVFPNTTGDQILNFDDSAGFNGPYVLDQTGKRYPGVAGSGAIIDMVNPQALDNQQIVSTFTQPQSGIGGQTNSIGIYRWNP